MGKKDKSELVETGDAGLAEAGVKKKKKKEKTLEKVAEAVGDEAKPKLTKEEKAAKKAKKEKKEGKETAAPVRESPRLAAAKAAAEVPEADLEPIAEEEDGFKVHKYVPPPEPEDETLQCRDCGGDFIFTIGEQEFFKSKGFDNKKTRCYDCTAAKKARFGEEGGKGGGGKGKGKGDGKGKGKGKGDGGGKGGGGGVCYAFQKGECSRGASCRFSHE